MLAIYKESTGFAMLIFAISGLSQGLVFEGRALPNGSCVFAIATHIGTILKNPHCEGQIVTDGKVTALYDSGTVENSTYPVMFASMDEFILHLNPTSIYLTAECPEHRIFHNDTYVCINSRPTTTSAEPAPPSENSALHGRHYFISGTVIVVTIVIFSLLILKLRKPVAHCICKEEKTPGPSATSSNDSLLIT